MIKEKLNATKASRDAYIARFIQPIKEKLDAAGLKYHMKGRTKREGIHAVLADFRTHHRYVSAEPKAYARLAQRA